MTANNGLAIIQGSPEWFQYKCGKVSASHISDVMAGGKGTTRKNYLARMVAERMSDTPIETYSNSAMQWGIETEPQARNAYSFRKGVEVVEVGFIDHPEIEGYGCSPDGLVNEDGLTEFKCPNTATHIATILAVKAGSSPKQVLGDKYYKQVQGQMDCTERVWCDYVSYDPRMPIELQMVIVRVPRDDTFISQIQNEVLSFIEDMINLVAELDEYGDVKPDNIYQRPAEVAPNKIDGEEVVWPAEDAQEEADSDQEMYRKQDEEAAAEVAELPGIPNDSGVVDNVRLQAKPEPESEAPSKQVSMDTLF